MTINELIDGISYDGIHGAVEVRRLKGNGNDLEKIFACTNGLRDLPDEVANMEIDHIYSEPWGNGETAIILEMIAGSK